MAPIMVGKGVTHMNDDTLKQLINKPVRTELREGDRVIVKSASEIREINREDFDANMLWSDDMYDYCGDGAIVELAQPNNRMLIESEASDIGDWIWHTKWLRRA